MSEKVCLIGAGLRRGPTVVFSENRRRWLGSRHALFHGEAYAHYRQQVSMILPMPLRKAVRDISMSQKAGK